MIIELTAFEKDLMNKLLDGEDQVLSLLREQYYHSIIVSRINTGAGFYLTFTIPDGVPRISSYIESVKSDFCFGDVAVSIPELLHGADFLIWVKNGALKQLEGYTFGEKWLTEISHYILNYRGGKRNLKTLCKAWVG
jgi:hypothetical protein